MKRIHLIIYGDVQGVGYRSWVLRQAMELSLTGWVKNRADGVVELMAEGTTDSLAEFTARCRRGPEVAWVEKVVATEQKPTGEFVSFTMEH